MKTIKTIALMLVVMFMCLAMIPTVSAESSYYEEQVSKFENMKSRTISIEIKNFGGFSRDKERFYARKVTGVKEDGSFILGGWECFSNPSKNFTLPGNYVHFGYSVDITWGTDFPYSGPFWTKTNTQVDSIRITLSGICRMVYVNIDVNGTCVVNESNCSSHSEWRP